MEENTKERICYLLAENHKLRNLNDELEKELALKDEIIRKQICCVFFWLCCVAVWRL